MTDKKRNGIITRVSGHDAKLFGKKICHHDLIQTRLYSKELSKADLHDLEVITRIGDEHLYYVTSDMRHREIKNSYIDRYNAYQEIMNKIVSWSGHIIIAHTAVGLRIASAGLYCGLDSVKDIAEKYFKLHETVDNAVAYHERAVRELAQEYNVSLGGK